MSYELSILRRAQKELAALPEKEYERVKSVILSFHEDPRPFGYKKLVGRGGYRIRSEIIE
jgi:mRNA interferase RelE/StbE